MNLVGNLFAQSLLLYAGFDDPELAAISPVIQFQNWNEPLQVHLALTGDPTEMM